MRDRARRAVIYRTGTFPKVRILMLQSSNRDAKMPPTDLRKWRVPIMALERWYGFVVCLVIGLMPVGNAVSANLRLISDPPSVIQQAPDIPFEVNIRVQVGT